MDEPTIDAVIEIERAMQRDAEQRLAACQEALFAEENGEEIAEYPACAPYDGCDTCIVREVLDAAWPHLTQLVRLAREDPEVAELIESTLEQA